MWAKLQSWLRGRGDRSGNRDDSAGEARARLNKTPFGFRRRLLSRLLVPIAPALVGRCDGLPEVDPGGAAVGAAELICGGPLEVLFTVISGVFMLNTLSLLTAGKLLKSLEPDRQADVLARAFNSRLFLLRGACVIVGLPLKIAHYNRDEVCRELGYDRSQLIEDALKHQVTRAR